MVYVLHMLQHYLLGGHFKMFTYHSYLKYLVNMQGLGRKICQWLLHFQEFDFEIIVKLGRMNARPDRLSRLELWKESTNLDYNLPDVHIFAVNMVDEYYEDIIHFFTIEKA